MGKDFVTIDDLRKLNNVDLIPKRFRIIYSTLFRTGMRPGELMKVKPLDFYKIIKDDGTTEYYFDLKTQKNKEKNEITPINIQDYSEMQDWIKVYNIPKKGFIFGSPRSNPPYSKPMSVSWLGRMLKDHLKLVGIEKDITPHSFRAGLVTYLLDQGYSYMEISNITRHQNLNVMKKHYDKRYKSRASKLVADINFY